MAYTGLVYIIFVIVALTNIIEAQHYNGGRLRPFGSSGSMDFRSTYREPPPRDTSYSCDDLYALLNLARALEERTSKTVTTTSYPDEIIMNLVNALVYTATQATQARCPEPIPSIPPIPYILTHELPSRSSNDLSNTTTDMPINNSPPPIQPISHQITDYNQAITQQLVNTPSNLQPAVNRQRSNHFPSNQQTNYDPFNDLCDPDTNNDPVNNLQTMRQTTTGTSTDKPIKSKRPKKKSKSKTSITNTDSTLNCTTDPTNDNPSRTFSNAPSNNGLTTTATAIASSNTNTPIKNDPKTTSTAFATSTIHAPTTSEPIRADTSSITLTKSAPVTTNASTITPTKNSSSKLTPATIKNSNSSKSTQSTTQHTTSSPTNSDTTIPTKTSSKSTPASISHVKSPSTTTSSKSTPSTAKPAKTTKHSKSTPSSSDHAKTALDPPTPISAKLKPDTTSPTTKSPTKSSSTQSTDTTDPATTGSKTPSVSTPSSGEGSIIGLDGSDLVSVNNGDNSLVTVGIGSNSSEENNNDGSLLNINVGSLGIGVEISSSSSSESQSESRENDGSLISLSIG